MKSYLRFLGRNKLYTAIEVVGLSVALAFVILLSCYIADDLSCDKDIKDKDRICLTEMFDVPMMYDQFMEIGRELPAVEDLCWFMQSLNKTFFQNLLTAGSEDGEQYVDAAAVSDNFFNIFTFPLSEGDPDKVFSTENGAVISERLAKALFPEGDAVGRSLKLTDMMYIDLDLTITGIYKNINKSIFRENDVLFSFDRYASLPIYSNTEQASTCFLKLHEGESHTDAGEAFTGEIKKRFKDMFGDSINDFEIHTIPFKEIRSQNYETFSMYFDNIRKSDMLGTYIIMCLFIVVIALLDYIVLTMAFSRFRLKEIATRRLLGTERKAVIFRCMAESLFLLMVSFIFAICIAFALKGQIGGILGSELRLFSQTGEFITMAGIIALMAAMASSVPSIVISSYKPIEVLKGEARYRDKMTYGKVFIGISGALSIIGIAVCLGITFQTRHMINQPLGYETDNILFIRFNTNKVGKARNINHYIDELKSQSHVDAVGRITGPPMYVHGTSSRHCRGVDGGSRWLYTIGGDRAAFDILGIEITADFGNSSDMEIYICEGSHAANPSFVTDNMLELLDGKTPLSGMCSDFRTGSLKDFDRARRMSGIQIYGTDNWRMQMCHPLVKVNVDEDKALKFIREFYAEKGYDETMVTISTLNEMLVEPFREERNTQKLMVIFTLISILMTAMTIIGLSSWYAKTNEGDTAVKKVFGSSEWQIFRETVVGFSVPVLISALIAIPLAYIYVGHWLEAYAYRIGNSALIYLAALIAVLLIVALSIAFQALRLMRTNPAEALKKE